MGPDRATMKGGVAAVLNNLMESSVLGGRFELRELATVREGGAFDKVLFMGRQLRLLRKDYDSSWVCHIHICSGTSCWRKLVFLKIAQSVGMRTILHLHGAEFKDFVATLPKLGRKAVRAAFASADVVVALSESWKRYLQEEFSLANVRVINNSIDCAHYPVAISDSLLIAFVGELCERKGVYDLVEALKELKGSEIRFQCVLAGNGEVEKVSDMITLAGLCDCVTCLGWVDKDGIADLLRRSSIQVLPSYHEGFPVSLVEGMACGNAIVASTIPGVVEAVGGEGSILVDPGDVAGLARALRDLLGDGEKARAMALANRHRVESKYDNEITHAQLAVIYDELFDGRR